MSIKSKAEFFFRVWIYSEDFDSVDVEVWFHDIETIEPAKRRVSDWIHESFSNFMNEEDHHKLFSVDREKNWQVIGKAEIKGWFDFNGEYDESIEIIDFKKSECSGWEQTD